MSIDKFFYFSLEKTGGWLPGKASERQSVIDEKQPKYVTVLDLSDTVDEDTAPEDKLKVRYTGPFYADWDCEDLMTGAGAVQRFLDLLRDDYEIDPGCVQIYATGGRGYHIELPFRTFCNNEPTIAGGVQYLPQVYREMANELYTEELDLAVYSAGRGRMWRTPNVERETAGRYKVPITQQQLRDMTPELYLELTSAPRPFAQLAEPKYSPVLGAKFDSFRKKVTQRYVENRKRSGDSNEAVKAMGGEYPDSVKRLMDGENLNPDTGLNKIALQLGILSNALGRSLEQHIDDCTGLIQKYRGDGHPTARSVRDELKRMYRYAAGNVAYQYSPGAMSAIMDDNSDAHDLRGDATKSGGKHAERHAKGDLSDLMQGMVNGAFGLYSTKGDDGMKRESQFHYDNNTATEMVDAESGESRGYIIDVMMSGQPKGTLQVNHLDFISSDAMKKTIGKFGGVAPRVDPSKSAGVFASVMQAARNNSRVYTLPKEGFNIVPDGEGGETLVWASADGCYASDQHRTYRYRNVNGNEQGNFRTDIAEALDLPDHENALEVVQHMLHFNNSDITVASVLGWLCACWLKPLHLKYGASFPLLELYGESGAGKTGIMLLLLKLFYLNNEPRATNASQGTAYGRRAMLSSSSSIPYFMDEFKPRHMSQDLVREIRSLFHELYTPSMQSARGGSTGGSGGWHELTFETKTTPLVFSTETAETETAVQERTVAAAFSKRNREGRAQKAFDGLFANRHVLSSVGKSLLRGTMGAKPELIKRLIDESHAQAYEALAQSGNSRIAYNMGVVLSGLKFLGKVLYHKFGAETFDEHLRERFEALQEAILTPSNHPTLVAPPVLVKVLRFMMTISWQDSPDADHNVKRGVEFDYTLTNQDLDLNLDAFFGRYKVACARRSVPAEFDNVETFMMAVHESSLCKEKQPPDSPLLSNVTNGQAVRVVRLAREALDTHNLGMFKTI